MYSSICLETLGGRYSSPCPVPMDILGDSGVPTNEQVGYAMSCHALCTYVYIVYCTHSCRLRLAFGFFDPDSPANFWFWFSHAFMLTLHGRLALYRSH